MEKSKNFFINTLKSPKEKKFVSSMLKLFINKDIDFLYADDGINLINMASKNELGYLDKTVRNKILLLYTKHLLSTIDKNKKVKKEIVIKNTDFEKCFLVDLSKKIVKTFNLTKEICPEKIEKKLIEIYAKEKDVFFKNIISLFKQKDTLDIFYYELSKTS